MNRQKNQVPNIGKLEPNHKGLSGLNPRQIDERPFTEATHGSIKALSCDRAGCRRRSDATRNDLSAAGRERDGRHRMRKRRGRRTGAGAGRGLSMTLSFLLTSLIVVASPGTGVLYTLAVALTQGGRASVAAAFGCTLGIVPHMLAAMLGLAAVLHTSALAFAALKWCGVVYLLYMAWQALRERGALAIEPRLDARSSRKVIVTGFLINILNPKLSIFFLAVLPQFIAADEAYPLLK